jgi:hypothetical protein
MALLASLLIVPLVIADDTVDQSASTTRPSQSNIKTWFANLADRDWNVREQARVDLMGLTRQDLPELLRLVRQSRPLALSQSAALHDIVMQVYLSGEPYEGNPASGFLGVRLEENSWADLLQQAPKVRNRDDNQDAAADDTAAATPPLGVVIADRIPGFSAFRMLRNGDLIVGVEEQPQVAIRDVTDLRTIVGTSRAGAVLHFQVFRAGSMMTVPVVLHAHPTMGSGMDFDFVQESQRRMNLADQYWKQTFAPVIPDDDDGVS